MDDSCRKVGWLHLWLEGLSSGLHSLLVSLPEVGTLQSGACAAGSIDKNVGEFIHSSASTVTSYFYLMLHLFLQVYMQMQLIVL